MFKKLSDIQFLIILLVSAVLLIYFSPQVVNRFVFLIYLYLFWKSDKDYLWIAFIFIILESPGGLFTGGERTETIRVPIYSILPGFSFTFQQFFLILMLFKAIKKRILFNPNGFIKNYLLILLAYFIFLIIIGILTEPSYDIFRYVYKVVINLTLFYSFYILINKEKDFINLFRLLIPFGFLAFGLLMYSLFYGEPIAKTLNPFTIEFHGVYEGEEFRPIEMTELLAIVFFFSLYFIMHRKSYFNRSLLIMLNVISFFAIVITATRSWVIMFSVFYFLSILFISTKTGKIVLKYGAAALILIIFLLSSDLFTEQLDSALKRISTIGLIYKGDITAGGTVQRYDIRAPAVMNTFWNESTIIFGTGFSTTYLDKADGHVGFNNLLLNTGFLGVIFFAFFFLSLVIKPFTIDSKLNFNNPYKKIIRIFPLALISMLFLNSGTQVFGYDIGTSRIFIFVFIIYFLNNQINCAIEWEYKKITDKSITIK